MMNVKEVCKLTGVSPRTLHFYDEIGLLKPIEVTESGYRLYNEASIQSLQQIMLFKEMDFSLKEIKRIMDSPNFERKKAIRQQIDLLILKKEHIENLINLAKQMESTGGYFMNFEAFNKEKLETYAAEAKKEWGTTEAYQEYEKKSANYSEEKHMGLANDMMKIFAEFGAMMDEQPENQKVQSQVKKLQNFITNNYYHCTNEILAGLGQMYSGGGEMTENIDRAGGKGTAEFVSAAIAIYVGTRKEGSY